MHYTPNLKVVKFTKFQKKFNCHVDALANLGSSSDSTIWRTIPVRYLEKPCINQLTSELAPDNSQPSDDLFSDLHVDHYSSNESVSDPPVDHYSSNDSPTNWMTLILRYIEHRELQSDKKQARKLQIQSVRKSIIGKILYRHSFSGPYLRCLDLEQALYII